MTNKKIKSVCPYCGVGCGIVLEVANNHVVKVTGDKEHPTNKGRLCTKGNTCAQAITESGRLEYAHRRQSRTDEPVRTSIDLAISETAHRLRAILDEHGPDALSFYVSGQMTLEAQYLINKLAKGYIRTNNIESNSRLCMASAGSGYKLSLGSDGPPGSYQDIDHTNLFFIIGANMADCHPILFLRMMDRVKSGAKLIVVDPRRNNTADKATLFLQIKPGTDLALLNGILHILIQNGHADPNFIAKFTSGWENMTEFLNDYTPEIVAEITGIPEADIRKAALWIGESPEWMTCWTMGLNQSTHGTWHTNAICNLHLATGKICRTGSGPFSLTGQPNAMGGREMGYMGPGLPGQRSVLVEEDRIFIENMWNIPQGSLKTDVGSGTISMFQNMLTGNIKACWIICTNPVATVPNRKNVIAALEAVELVITQDAFFHTETNRYADIMLPGSLWSETEGVMVNSERNLTLLNKAVDPPGEALPDWQIIARVACEMGYSSAFSYESASEVYQEIQQAWNPKSGYDIRGASYEKLSETPMQWPCAPNSPNDRNPIRYLNNGISQILKVNDDGSVPNLAFPTESGKGIFLPRPFMQPAEMPDNEFSFVLNTGRLQHQWHTMTKTGKIPILNKLNAGPFIEIHEEDAAILLISDQDLVEIRSRRGKAVLPAVITTRVRPGNCFAPFHWNDIFGENLAINEVTNDAIDPISFQPEFKYCAVSLERVTNQLKLKTAKQKEEMVMAQIDILASMLDIQPSSTITLDHREKIYLSGFIASLRTDESLSTFGVPFLPLSAPLEESKRDYLDGLLAGMFSRTHLPEAKFIPTNSILHMPDKTMESTKVLDKDNKFPVTILWASQTGNAENVAIDCAKKLQSSGYNIRLLNMNDYSISELSTERFVLFIASTFGAGDPPDNGENFFYSLSADDMTHLPQLQFAVLAFGDTNYDQFCGFGRQLDARMEQLGAQRAFEFVCCDTDFHNQAESWMNNIDLVIKETTATTEVMTYDRNHPFHTNIQSNHRLNSDNSEKETRHVIFNLKNTQMKYDVGDALGIWPTNCPQLVEDILGAMKLQPSSLVFIEGKGKMTIEKALLQHFDITRITPEFLQFVQDHSGSNLLNQLLKMMDNEQLKDWLGGRQLIDVLLEFPINSFTLAEDFIRTLKVLQPRLYSISSSQKVHPDEVHVIVSTVRYEHNGKARKGVCSTFLADRANENQQIPIFIQKTSHFRPPHHQDVPIIMIGPGTGVGPFRAFLQERQVTKAKGKNWLIFGEQREHCDFYFQEELENLLKEGCLHRLDTAFSRDQPDKIYVQDRMFEHGMEMWAWIQEGAYFYVCGDAETMAKEVDITLKNIIQVHGNMTKEESERYVREMSHSKRYLRDVY
ncbi:bifunctional nitrate reductase/sulfite reductase flavoprotein subunit alpha [Paenibacillus crassostreae]|uniref:assimilatory sulfite reductase (NADPH) n=1 Tax=Paenibacillus crassostreae TaxID=1763538 RepID=A0A167FBT2_9BACL|nr:bifunctional nitrate reductase/sulfite reductase flavoprotein subunit alpha [Paenibacillus crassostreae]AOZ90844.1 reductase [Paenibacillus crassostreae]OAB76390.1 reductase [Paenibacillus crassostreae]